MSGVTPLDQMIDEAYVAKKEVEEPPFRNHLGGSMIGRPCERELYYNFHWMKKPDFEGRMLRLFDRGHDEEFRFVEYLLSVGIEVRPYSEQLWWSAATDEYTTREWGADLSGGVGAFEHVTYDKHHIERAKARGLKLKQWRVSDVEGHFGGSLDGISVSPFEINDRFGTIHVGEEFLNEFKTHNTKSFCALAAAKGGVKEAKPVHWEQMQTYMGKRGLRVALYMAVNKNDDDLYFEVVTYDPTVLPTNIEKARRVIYAKTVPNRIGKHPSWHECKFCEYAKICHYGEPPARNCRSCQFSEPVADGKWRCNKWSGAIIPSDVIMAGCDNYKAITD